MGGNWHNKYCLVECCFKKVRRITGNQWAMGQHLHGKTLSMSLLEVWFDLVWFYGISNIVGYLMPNLFLYI